MIDSEKPGLEQIWVTNQGTDAHLLARQDRKIARRALVPGPRDCCSTTKDGHGGHVSFTIRDGDDMVRCMAYEPTKNFRQVVRQLVPGDTVIAVGSFKKGSINLEKIRIVSLARQVITRPPLCLVCNKRMTSDGKGQGWKCKKCSARSG